MMGLRGAALALVAGGALAMAPMTVKADPAVQGIVGAAAAVIGAGIAGEYFTDHIGFNKIDEPYHIAFGLGKFDLQNDHDGEAGLGRAELRFGDEFFYVRPNIGAEATDAGTYYLYAGFGLDTYFGKNFIISPNFAVGYYDDSDHLDLGSELEFRSGIEVTYRFDNGMRIGGAFHHISNADTQDINPGVETATLVFILPF